jgi:hypothetical protein
MGVEWSRLAQGGALAPAQDADGGWTKGNQRF